MRVGRFHPFHLVVVYTYLVVYMNSTKGTYTKNVLHHTLEPGTHTLEMPNSQPPENHRRRGKLTVTTSSPYVLRRTPVVEKTSTFAIPLDMDAVHTAQQPKLVLKVQSENVVMDACRAIGLLFADTRHASVPPPPP